jgi:hypothetical protein
VIFVAKAFLAFHPIFFGACVWAAVIDWRAGRPIQAGALVFAALALIGKAMGVAAE